MSSNNAISLIEIAQIRIINGSIEQKLIYTTINFCECSAWIGKAKGHV